MRTLHRASGLTLVAALLVAGGLSVASPAQAATGVTVSISTRATGAEIESTNGVLYFDSAKGDTADTAYQIAYEGTLDMATVWSNYEFARSFYIATQILKGMSHDQATERWERFEVVGGFEIGFTVDPAYTTVDPAFMSCDTLQQQYELQNSGDFPKLMTCQSVTYDGATGAYVAKFATVHTDGSPTTTKELDAAAAQPAKLLLSTPQGSLFVQQSDFVPGESFSMINPYVKGSLTLKELFVNQLPINFASNSAAAVPLEMVHTYNANYAFASATGGKELPAGVLELQPRRQTSVKDGETVTAPQPASTMVLDGDRGTWLFDGWQPPSATAAGGDLAFVGYWSYHVNPDAKFGVRYEFVDRDGGALPDAVTELLPPPAAAMQGETVAAAPPAKERVVIETTAQGKRTTTTWVFDGWDAPSATVDGANVVFTGTWSSTVKTVPVTPPEEGGQKGPGTHAPGTLATSGTEGSGAIVTLVAMLCAGLALAGVGVAARLRRS